jgi:hypothetical protein
MFRLLTILSVLAALTMSVSAAPASARVQGKMHLDDISLGVITDKALPKLDDTETGWWQRGR